MIYYFTQPFLKQSTKKIHKITTEQQEVVGGIQRYYKTPFQRCVDFILDGFFLNFKVYDKEGKLIVEAIDKLTLIRDSWDIIEDGSRHHLNCVTKIKTNPRYIFSYHGEEFVIQKDFMDKYIRIKDVKTNKVISEYEYLTLTPPRKVSINIIEPTLSIYVIICLNLILSTKYD
ncbi:tubby C-terminal domain-like protein [Paenibacillus bouchesdurhonensis]|uniref:tubby C-terminal domain-like protein n=1 Tax=Paenibacillus bouchesdurhonensis TaxID=1870990 RepID=UPI000DA63108|nr:hypothetical protein [Paenibacillus bouchesdurhonensis]